ncbi:hypothetical protein FACS189449_11280 [Alphaproteobacteria bacterium]|nr:hypothetical protein FACS189449_11280 [Alphaproteobacteria bacterium]
MDSITNDLVFKLLFSDERSKRMLIHLLSSVVGFKVVDVDIRKTEMIPEFIGRKESRLDVLAKDATGKLYNVEMQKECDPYMRERSLFYWSEVFYKQLPKKGKYSDLRETICITILEENLFKDDRFWHTYHMREDETHELLTDMEEIHFLEIAKMHEFKKDNPITLWLEFFKSPHSEVVKKIGEFEPVIKEAVQMFDIVLSDPEAQEWIRMREKGEHDFYSAMETAEERGKMEGKMEMARSLLQAGVSAEVVESF